MFLQRCVCGSCCKYPLCTCPAGGPQYHHVPSEPQGGVCRLLRTEQDCLGDGGRHRQPHDHIQQEPVTELPHCFPFLGGLYSHDSGLGSKAGDPAPLNSKKHSYRAAMGVASYAIFGLHV